jgi:hypothetical protein
MKLFRREWWYVIILAVIIAGAYTWVKSGVRAQGLAANLLEVKDNSIVIEGRYIQTDGKIYASDEPYQVEIVIGPSTILKRVTFNIPAGDKMFKVSELPKTETDADFETLRKDFQESPHMIGVVVRAEKNIFGRNKFEAWGVRYTLPAY